MNVYELLPPDATAPPVFVAANSLADALATDHKVVSARMLGELVFAEGAKALVGGRRLTEEEIKATITPDGQYLISLEDGKKYKSLNRSLKRAGLTADQYRAKWGLPAAYPMVSVAYSLKRSDMAKAAGLGKGAKK